MLIEITIYNKKQKPIYNFLVDPDYSNFEDLAEIIDKELSFQPKGYYGVAKSFKTDVEYYRSY
jgi:hypothetical protein